jgi:hypothetical protein
MKSAVDHGGVHLMRLMANIDPSQVTPECDEQVRSVRQRLQSALLNHCTSLLESLSVIIILIYTVLVAVNRLVSFRA